MTLRYPEELNTGDVDYVIFTAHKYVTNAAGANGPATGSPVILYMPTSSPAMSNPNGWGRKNFEGPLGALVRDVASEGAGMVDDVFREGGGQKSIDGFKSAFSSAAKNAGGAARQLGVGAVASVAQMEPNQLLAISRGKIYNPNVELLYKGPELRGFTFNYTFVPKSAGEAATVNSIIKEFKVQSSPSDTGDGMYELPSVYQVQYMSRGGVNPNMNQFKRAALTDITVQANPGLPMHMSFENGMPVLTQISLSFTEVDVITKQDQMSSSSAIGY